MYEISLLPEADGVGVGFFPRELEGAFNVDGGMIAEAGDGFITSYEVRAIGKEKVEDVISSSRFFNGLLKSCVVKCV